MAERKFFEDTDLYRNHMDSPSTPYPEVIQFEVTSECNLRCIMCPLTTETRKRCESEKLFSLEECQKLSELFEHASEVELTGFGEMFTHPQILDILRFLKSKDLAVYGTSNGMLLHEEVSEAIVSEGLMDVLCFSIDAATGPTYRRIRKGGSFETVISNIRALSRKRKERGSPIPILYFSFIAMEKNIRELPEFVRLASECGAAKVIVQHIVENRLTAGQNLTGHPGLADEYVAAAMDEARRTGIELDMRNLDPVQQGSAQAPDPEELPTPDAFKRKNRLVKDCPFPWEHIFLKSNYDVQICAILWEQMIMGNLRQEPIERLWNSPAYRRLRRHMCGTDAPEECVYCYFKGWRNPTPIEDVSASITMAPENAGQLGKGWHLIERDAKGRPHRWGKKQASLFLRNSGGSVLSVELYEHPEAPFLRGEVLVNDRKVGDFTSHDLWGIPLRIPLPHMDDEFLQVDFRFEETWHPGKILNMIGKRWLTALFYGASIEVGPKELESRVTPEGTLHPQMCLGWFAPEKINGRWAAWTQKRAQLVLPGESEGRIEFEALLPQGMEPVRLTLLVDDLEIGILELPPDGRFHVYEAPPGPSKEPHRVVSLVATDYDPRGLGSRDCRPLAALVSRVELVKSKRNLFSRLRKPA